MKLQDHANPERTGAASVQWRELLIGIYTKQGIKMTSLEQNLKQQAQIHAQEARAQKASVHEIYQIIGSNKGDWNGSEPVKEFIDSIKAALEECHQAFRDRKHGGVAEQKLRHDLENILGIHYD